MSCEMLKGIGDIRNDVTIVKMAVEPIETLACSIERKCFLQHFKITTVRSS